MRPSAASPLNGKYLVRHRLLNLLLRGIDGLLGLYPARRKEALPRPRRILLANIAHLGDALLATGVPAWLAQAFPDIEVGFLAGSWSRPVLERQPHIAHLHSFDHAWLARSPASRLERLRRHRTTRRQALAEIRAVGYDLAIDLYPYFPSAIPLLWSAGIPFRLGYTSAGFGPLLTHPTEWSLKDWHVTGYHRHLLTQLPTGLCPPGELLPTLPRACAPPAGLPDRFVVVHPGAGAAFKEWPEWNWREVIQYLTRRGMAVVLTGHGAGEAALCTRLVAGMGSVVDLCGQLNWQQFVAVVRQAQLLLGVDSVAGHVASAVQTPCVVVATGIPHPAHWIPAGRLARVLRARVACAPCYRSRGCPGMDCVRGVTVEEVVEAVEQGLANRQCDAVA